MQKQMTKTDLKEQTLVLIATNPFLDQKQKDHWTSKVEIMEADELQQLIDMLEDSKKAFFKLMYQALESDKDGVLAERLGEYMKGAEKEIDGSEVEKTLNKNLTKI